LSEFLLSFWLGHLCFSSWLLFLFCFSLSTFNRGFSSPPLTVSGGRKWDRADERERERKESGNWWGETWTRIITHSALLESPHSGHCFSQLSQKLFFLMEGWKAAFKAAKIKSLVQNSSFQALIFSHFHWGKAHFWLRRNKGVQQERFLTNTVDSRFSRSHFSHNSQFCHIFYAYQLDVYC